MRSVEAVVERGGGEHVGVREQQREAEQPDGEREQHECARGARERRERLELRHADRVAERMHEHCGAQVCCARRHTYE